MCDLAREVFFGSPGIWLAIGFICWSLQPFLIQVSLDTDIDKFMLASMITKEAEKSLSCGEKVAFCTTGCNQKKQIVSKRSLTVMQLVDRCLQESTCFPSYSCQVSHERLPPTFPRADLDLYTTQMQTILALAKLWVSKISRM